MISTPFPAKRRRPPCAMLHPWVGAMLMALGLLASGPAGAQTPASEVRLVAAGGAITETLYALGLRDRIVGVDATSLHPPEALKEKANIGYVRALSAEGVLSLRPTLVLSIPSAGPPDVLKLIREAGVPLAELPDEPTPAGVVARIERLGELTGTVAQAAVLTADVRRKFASLEADRAHIRQPKRVLFVLALREGRPMVGGRNSSADAIIRLAGGANAADAVEGFRPMTDEAVIAAAPDIILMMDRGQHAVAADDLFRLAAFSATPAAVSRSLVVMNGLYLLGFGPRTPDAARDLMRALYPEMASTPAGGPKR